VDGKVGGKIEFDEKRFRLDGEIDGKVGDTAWKKEVEENSLNGGFKKETKEVVQAPARVQTPGGS
jgi:hypothetical protein